MMKRDGSMIAEGEVPWELVGEVLKELDATGTGNPEVDAFMAKTGAHARSMMSTLVPSDVGGKPAREASWELVGEVLKGARRDGHGQPRGRRFHGENRCSRAQHQERPGRGYEVAGHISAYARASAAHGCAAMGGGRRRGGHARDDSTPVEVGPFYEFDSWEPDRV